jgi:hypothetical protein
MSTGLINSNISSALVRENQAPGAIDTVFRDTQFLNFMRAMGRVRMWQGGYPQSWALVTAANTSAESFVEGQALPASGKQSYARTSLNPFFVRVVAEASGHVMDQVAHGGVYLDPVQDALEKGTLDLFKKFEDSLVGTTQDQGVQSVIDSGDTYAGLAPGTYTTHASIETAVAGALSFTALEDNIETGAISAMAAPTHILSCQNQITNYKRLLGVSAGNSAVTAVRFDGSATDFGIGGPNEFMGGLQYQGRPWIGVSGLTQTVILMLDMRDDLAIELYRTPRVEPLAKTDDGQKWAISMAGAIVCKTRRRHIKLTGVTA